MIEAYVKDIQNALKNRSFFSALALALTLPDICGMAEFPGMSVGERYVSFYDKYIKSSAPTWGNPYISGEVVYNLRNTYLHQGSPNINSEKIKEEINQVDKFILLLPGEKSYIWEFSQSLSHPAFPNSTVKLIGVDVAYLCNIICVGSLSYYKENKAKFEFNFDVISQEDFFGENKKDLSLVAAMPMIEKTLLFVRTFFEENFNEKKFTDKKGQIIAAIIESETKTQLNGKLSKLFRGEDVKILFKRLRPMLKNMRGK